MKFWYIEVTSLRRQLTRVISKVMSNVT